MRCARAPKPRLRFAAGAPKRGKTVDWNLPSLFVFWRLQAFLKLVSGPDTVEKGTAAARIQYSCRKSLKFCTGCAGQVQHMFFESRRWRIEVFRLQARAGDRSRRYVLGPFSEAIRVLLRICITRTSFAVRFDNSTNFRIAFSWPDTVSCQITAPSGRTSNKS
jgi:hypothetical protein